MIRLTPYIDKEKINKAVEKANSNLQYIDSYSLDKLKPYLNRETLNKVNQTQGLYSVSISDNNVYNDVESKNIFKLFSKPIKVSEGYTTKLVITNFLSNKDTYARFRLESPSKKFINFEFASDIINKDTIEITLNEAGNWKLGDFSTDKNPKFRIVNIKN